MSAHVIRVTPEITGSTAPTASGKPEAEKAQPTNQNNAPAPDQQVERPKWLPEKFKTAEEFANSYAELEKKLGQPKPDEAPPIEDEKKSDEVVKPDQAKTGDEAFKPYFEEFEKSGKLSDDSYAALEKQGFSRKVVDAYARGVAAERSDAEGKVFEAVGGQEQYAQIVAWAGTNLKPSETAAYNSILETGNVDQIALAASGLKTRFEAANGKPAKLVHGSSSGSSVQTFRSSAEVTRAMSDPRYRTDPAYRDEVAQRLVGSNAL